MSIREIKEKNYGKKKRVQQTKTEVQKEKLKSGGAQEGQEINYRQTNKEYKQDKSRQKILKATGIKEIGKYLKTEMANENRDLEENF